MSSWLWFLIVPAIALGVAGRVWWDRIAPYLMTRPAPTQPDEPDEREASGADSEYGDDLEQLRHSERELASIAEELELNILDVEQRQWAVDALDLRLMVAEDIDHFDGRIERLLAEWQPGWWEETAVLPLPSFELVHALVDETGEFAVVAG
jgi:hypothetical protein